MISRNVKPLLVACALLTAASTAQAGWTAEQADTADRIVGTPKPVLADHMRVILKELGCVVSAQDAVENRDLLAVPMAREMALEGQFDVFVGLFRNAAQLGLEQLMFDKAVEIDFKTGNFALNGCS